MLDVDNDVLYQHAKISIKILCVPTCVKIMEMLISSNEQCKFLNLQNYLILLYLCSLEYNHNKKVCNQDSVQIKAFKLFLFKSEMLNSGLNLRSFFILGFLLMMTSSKLDVMLICLDEFIILPSKLSHDNL
jgi:hypothetical protein